MNPLLREPLFYILFIYGASFLLVAFLVAKGAAGLRSVPLVSAFNFLALFGLIHGTTEFVDWVRFIRKTLGAPDIAALTWLSQVSLILSFVVLLQFGINLLVAQAVSRPASWLRVVPGVALLVFVGVIVVRDMRDILTIGLMGRYAFGFAGAVLASIALAATARALQALGDNGLVAALSVAAVAFAAYSVFGGLMITPIAGVPIQLFRSACAFAIAVAAFSLIRLSSAIAGAPSARGAEAV